MLLSQAIELGSTLASWSKSYWAYGGRACALGMACLATGYQPGHDPLPYLQATWPEFSFYELRYISVYNDQIAASLADVVSVVRALEAQHQQQQQTEEVLTAA